MAELLRAENLTAGYGDAVVLDDVSLALDEGGSLAVLGRNGVGKTTLLLTLLGLTRLKRGKLALRHLRSRHRGSEVRIFSCALNHASPTRVPGNIQHGRERP